MEIARTYRLWVIPVVFLLFSLSAPPSAKFLPELLEGQLAGEDITITMPEPTANTAFQTYLKNLTQMGLLAVILLTMGLISEERSRGILAQVIVKPVGRPAIVVAKWLVHGTWLLIVLALSSVACYLYTLALFGEGGGGGFWTANVFFAGYLTVIFSFTLAMSAVFKTQIAAGAASLGFFFFLTVVPAFGRGVGKYAPSALNDMAYKALSERVSTGDAAGPALVAAMTAIMALVAAVAVFNRQEL